MSIHYSAHSAFSGLSETLFAHTLDKITAHAAASLSAVASPRTVHEGIFVLYVTIFLFSTAQGFLLNSC